MKSTSTCRARALLRTRGARARRSCGEEENEMAELCHRVGGRTGFRHSGRRTSNGRPITESEVLTVQRPSREVVKKTRYLFRHKLVKKALEAGLQRAHSTAATTVTLAMASANCYCSRMWSRNFRRIPALLATLALAVGLVELTAHVDGKIDSHRRAKQNAASFRLVRIARLSVDRDDCWAVALKAKAMIRASEPLTRRKRMRSPARTLTSSETAPLIVTAGAALSGGR